MAGTSRKTVFVIGAGASHEAGLPVGETLKQQIAKILRTKDDMHLLNLGDRRVLEACAAKLGINAVHQVNSLAMAAKLVADGMASAQSIDHFLDAHQSRAEVRFVGKLAIVLAILDAERTSRLFIDPSNIYNKLNYGALKDTWYPHFSRLLVENCQFDRLAERLSNLSFVIFNYDRCFEHYLLNKIKDYYDVKLDTAAGVLQSLEVYHPYGTVGNLPWFRAYDHTLFGATIAADTAIRLSDKIRTFTESIERDEMLPVYRSKIENADRIVFLGFGFHRMNLELLAPVSHRGTRATARQVVYASGKNVSRNNADSIEANIAKRLGVNSKRVSIQTGLTCAELFDDRWFDLSLAD